MRIGVPRETKKLENRVGLTPDSVAALTERGHSVHVEAQAGIGVGFSDEDYENAGAEVVTVDEAWSGNLIVKVKEPNLEECAKLNHKQMLFTYLHLAADPAQAVALIRSGTTAIAYETVRSVDGRLPLLQPMSAVAGRMSIQVGARALERENGGRGVLLGGVNDVAPAQVAILGGGTAGENATQMALGLGANVCIVEKNKRRAEELYAQFEGRVQVSLASPDSVSEAVVAADLIVGSVLIPGATAPKLVTREMLRTMKEGTAMVDISIDQGGCFETSHPTTHDDPMYIVDGVVHYCVANMPGAVPRTSTLALNKVTLPYVIRLADYGWYDAMRNDEYFSEGLNVLDGHIVNPAVAASLGYDSPRVFGEA